MTLREAIIQNELLISDGGMGTELQKLGLELNCCADEWCLKYPDRVAAIHRKYVDAGSQLITTSTFNSNRFALTKHDLADKQAETARAGARIAKEAMAGRGWVLGDVGPCGDLLEPLGAVKPDQLRESLKVQIGALLEGGADAILLETMSSMDEVAIGLAVARELNAPFVIVTAAFNPGKSGPRTMMGTKPETLARLAAEEGADMGGANCGKLTRESDFLLLIERMRAAAPLPVMLQPNAGEPEMSDGQIVYRCGPADLAERLAPIANQVKILGGCCGSTPDHIRAIHDRLRPAH